MEKELKKLLIAIEKHNENLYSKKEKIDFSKTKKNWGKDVIPKKFWINPKKSYRTRNGMFVSNLTISKNNDTFCVKASYSKKKDSESFHYGIWTIDGRHSILELETEMDLIEV